MEANQEDSSITPSKLLQDLLEVSEKEDVQVEVKVERLAPPLSLISNAEQVIRAEIQQKQKIISGKRQKVKELQLLILQTNKFDTNYIQLHDERRTIQKEILDDEFDLIKLERDRQVRNRNRSAINIVIEDDKEQEEPQQIKIVDSVIQEAPPDQEESLHKITYIQQLSSSVLSREEKSVTPASNKNKSQKKETVKNSQQQKEQLKSKFRKKETPKYSAKLSQYKKSPFYSHSMKELPHYYSSGLQTSMRRSTLNMSSDEFYRWRLSVSILEDCKMTDYLNSRYLS